MTIEKYVPLTDASEHTHFKGSLVVGTAVNVGDIYEVNGISYECKAAHTAASGNMPTDLSFGGSWAIAEVLSGTGQSFTLSQSPLNGNIMLWYNGVLQTPTTDYTVSGMTLTLITETVAAGDSLVASFAY